MVDGNLSDVSRAARKLRNRNADLVYFNVYISNCYCEIDRVRYVWSTTYSIHSGIRTYGNDYDDDDNSNDDDRQNKIQYCVLLLPDRTGTTTIITTATTSTIPNIKISSFAAKISWKMSSIRRSNTVRSSIC